ncbi:MAG TPA: hypothetical protein VFZ34_10725 [Blastocatellia bacterium]|nr:hypothetical protein [Blastocatellia bacterium]
MYELAPFSGSMRAVFGDGDAAKAGYEVDAVKDHIPIDSPDPIVIAQAQTLNAILLTLNGDFADIINYPLSACELSRHYRVAIEE